MRQSGCCDAMNYYRVGRRRRGPAAAAAAVCRMRQIEMSGGGSSCPIQRRRDVDTGPTPTITTCVNGERCRQIVTSSKPPPPPRRRCCFACHFPTVVTQSSEYHFLRQITLERNKN